MCKHEQTNFENVEHLLNYAHAKNGEVYIYNEDGNEERLASYVAALCTSKLSADDILNGDCFECDFACSAGVLNFCAIQAAELREKLTEARARNGLRTIITSRFCAKELYGVSEAIGDVVTKACGGTQNFAIEVEQTVKSFEGDGRAQKFSVHDIERGDYAPFA